MDAVYRPISAASLVSRQPAAVGRVDWSFIFLCGGTSAAISVNWSRINQFLSFYARFRQHLHISRSRIRRHAHSHRQRDSEWIRDPIGKFTSRLSIAQSSRESKLRAIRQTIRQLHQSRITGARASTPTRNWSTSELAINEMTAHRCGAGPSNPGSGAAAELFAGSLLTLIRDSRLGNREARRETCQSGRVSTHYRAADENEHDA